MEKKNRSCNVRVANNNFRYNLRLPGRKKKKEIRPIRVKIFRISYAQIRNLFPNTVFPPVLGEKWRRSEHAPASNTGLYRPILRAG